MFKLVFTVKMYSFTGIFMAFFLLFKMKILKMTWKCLQNTLPSKSGVSTLSFLEIFFLLSNNCFFIFSGVEQQWHLMIN